MLAALEGVVGCGIVGEELLWAGLCLPASARQVLVTKQEARQRRGWPPCLGAVGEQLAVLFTW